MTYINLTWNRSGEKNDSTNWNESAFKENAYQYIKSLIILKQMQINLAIMFLIT